MDRKVNLTNRWKKNKRMCTCVDSVICGRSTILLQNRSEAMIILLESMLTKKDIG